METDLVKQLKGLRVKYADALRHVEALLSLEGVLLESKAPNQTPPVPVMVSPTVKDGGKPAMQRFRGGRDRVLEVIRSKGRFIHLNEMMEVLNGPGGQLERFEKESVYRAVRNALQGLRSQGKIRKHQADTQAVNTFWGLDAWVEDVNGKEQPKADRMFDKERMK